MNFKDWINSDDSEIWTSDGLDGAQQAWDYQQAKIDAVIKYLDGCSSSLDIDIDKIQELLK
jgi:hypothetical protein